MAADDLDPLFSPPPQGPAQTMSYRQGVVVAWNPLTAQNTIRVGATELTDVPILNTSEAILLVPGDVVGIMGAGSSMAILGRLTIPGSADAASALNILGGRIVSATIATPEDTTSSTYTDLTTPGPVCQDVLVGSSGKVLVILGFDAQFVAGEGGLMSYKITGATTVAASETRAQGLTVGGTDAQVFEYASKVILHSGLTPGYNTFTAQYRAVAGTAEFINRILTVIPI